MTQHPLLDKVRCEDTLSDITIIGTVSFKGAKSTHSIGQIGIIDYKKTCLLFPVSESAARILSRPPESLDPSEHYILRQHVQELIDERLHVAFLATIADAHDLGDTEQWIVNIGYVDATETTSAKRLITMTPPKDSTVTPADYVLPMMTRARMHGGPFVEIEFDTSTFNDDDADEGY